LTNSGIPWVWLSFGAPNLYWTDERIPPALSGLPKNSSKSEWITFRQQWNQLFKDLTNDLNQYYMSRGAQQLMENGLYPHSPYLNIYVYPTELDNKDFKISDLKKGGLISQKWTHFDCFMKKSDKVFPIPEELNEKPGKLVYLSMREYADSNLMKRLTAILAKTNNKFIVAKDSFHNNYQLPDNMWGSEMLTQSEVISSVDLVITCGDYKTITDAFFYGKPLIVMPLFGDQLDNGQSVKESCYGIRLNPFTCSLPTTFASINTMLADFTIHEKMSNTSHIMQNSVAAKDASILIEKILNSN